jgi:hypothetical protein
MVYGFHWVGLPVEDAWKVVAGCGGGGGWGVGGRRSTGQPGPARHDERGPAPAQRDATRSAGGEERCAV